METSRRDRARRKLPPVPAVLLGALGALVLGTLIGLAADPSPLVGTTGYVVATGLLLAVGLYGSTYGIDLADLRRDLRGVVAAVTLGVVLKAGMISGVMVWAFDRPEYLVLGIVVAQIDPLSVAALSKDGHMSQRARSLLTAWASFDDPMTVLLTLYAAGYAYTAAGHTGTPSVMGGGARGYALGLALNALLLAGALLVWWAGGRLWPARRAGERPERPRRPATPLAALVVVVMLLLAAANMLMLAVAVAGLFLRTRAFTRPLARAVTSAFLLATVLLGLFVAQGVSLGPGLLLGASAFVAQAVVAVLLMPLFVRGLSRRDRVLLGIGQQNGLTAVLLALTLERDFPKTVGIVAPAVVTVNLLHYGAQTLFGCWSRHRAGKNRRPAAPEQSLPRRQAAGEGRRGEVPPAADGLRSSA
ncbi:cation:proton antiporter [Streptomyces sp. WAC04114]|uniref:cation:proton antiporter n=1 Tax=Streptomyces sp. WAC04114 TaxID=2867961 RepID=UPI001C8B5B83|nr:cation:proton antiporter [Streptomyces sp. WAC04114]MBX9360654.1 cation:proton antiporter [Streptomyces sp. WAC04114]